MAYNGNRQLGKFEMFVTELKALVQDGKDVCVIGAKSPLQISTALKGHGVTVTSTPVKKKGDIIGYSFKLKT